MPRPRVNGADQERLTARFPDGTLLRIKNSLAEGEPMSSFLRVAVERELAQRANRS